MTVVSTKEFHTNQDKYFDIAMNEQVFVKRDNIMFIVTREKKYKEPDDDYHRAIPIEDVRDSIVDYIRKKHTNNI